MSPRVASSAPFTLVKIDVASAQPLHRQICESIRQAILDGHLTPGTQLPAARMLARELGVSRQTVVSAVEQLCTEGYLESRTRSGMFISPTLSKNLLQTYSTRKSKPAVGAPLEDTSKTSLGAVRPFRNGFPAADAFPWALWARLLTRHIRRGEPALAGYGHPWGYAPLRRAIAAYVSAARGVICSPEQIVVTCGARQALDLVARTLVKPGMEMWIENPSYLGARQVFGGIGAKLVPVPIDEHGLSVKEGIASAPRARLVYVTPSHQYPLGITMSAARRLELVAWARRTGAWIIEDDYDSELRYTSRPLASLQSLDGGEHVIYVGTFSKTLFPSLRLGYLVVPSALLEDFLRQCSIMHCYAPTFEQAALTEFLTEGHFARHVRRMRGLYDERRNALLHAIEHNAADVLRPGPDGAGMHLIGWLPDTSVDTTVAARAAEAGIETKPLSRYWLSPSPKLGYRPGLLLGFAGFTPSVMASAVEQLARVVKSLPLPQASPKSVGSRNRNRTAIPRR